MIVIGNRHPISKERTANMNEVRIYNPEGKLKKIVTPEQLTARSDKIFKAAFRTAKVYSGSVESGTCEECKKEFPAKTDRAMYCSPKCTNRAYKKRKANESI